MNPNIQELESLAQHKITAKTATGAAAQVLRAIKTMPGGANAHIRTSNYGPSPTVVWEAGPYEWAAIATGPGDIWAEELGGSLTDAYKNNPTFALHGQPRWFAEPETSYALSFHKI
jgi:hypothetical protein